jgi:aromatic-L-amino-acid/L-tryptophan decarboxylase
MAPDSSQPPLTLPPDQMRRLGYQVVDLVVDALAGLRDRPLEAGCVLVRDVALLESIFSTRREFLLDAAAGDREVNFTDRALQRTRSFRAFKLWLSLKVFGLDAFAAAVRHGMDLAGYADAMLADELATLSSTVLDGRTTLRLCTVNPRTTREDVEAALARVDELAATV